MTPMQKIRWTFVVAYRSAIVNEQEMVIIVDDLNMKSVRYDYRFRKAIDSSDWIVERRKG